jgi:hypothetical protein
MFGAGGGADERCDGLYAKGINATLKQQIFDLPQRKRITDVHYHREADYLGRTIEISERILHPEKLRNFRSWLKLI